MLQSNSSLQNVAKRVNFGLNLSQWLKANKLSLNVTKTELINFHLNSKKIDHSLKFKLFHRLTQPSTVKYLGILIDIHLQWLKQIELKLNQTNGILSKLRNNTSVQTLKMAYHSLFSPHLLYGSQLWGHTNLTNQKKFQKLQSRAFRNIVFKKQQDYIRQYWKELEVLKFSYLLYLQNCLFTWRPETNQKLANSFADLKLCGGYQNKSQTKGLPYIYRSMAHSLLNVTV